MTKRALEDSTSDTLVYLGGESAFSEKALKMRSPNLVSTSEPTTNTSLVDILQIVRAIATNFHVFSGNVDPPFL